MGHSVRGQAQPVGSAAKALTFVTGELGNDQVSLKREEGLPVSGQYGQWVRRAGMSVGRPLGRLLRWPGGVLTASWSWVVAMEDEKRQKNSDSLGVGISGTWCVMKVGDARRPPGLRLRSKWRLP